MHTVGFILLAATLGVSWEDAQGRFTLEPPKGWRLLRGESTPSIPVFRGKKRRKGTASVSVTVTTVPDAIGVGGVHRERLKAIELGTGRALVDDRPDVLGGYRGRRLIYTVTGDSGPQQTVHEVFTQLYNRGFILTLTAESRHFDAYEEDFEAWTRGFEPLDGTRKAASSGESPLIGRWVGVKNPTSVLVLSADGSMRMDEDQGSYAVSRDTIVTLLKDGGQKVYSWDVKGKTLVLRTKRGQLRFRRAPW